MGWIWTIFLGLSLLYSCRTGQIGALAGAALEGASAGVTLAISLAGPICLWSGICTVMEHTGWMHAITVLLSPLLRRLFPTAWQDRQTREALSGNVSANLLGLGNAATPLGIRAAKQMAEGCGGHASDELCKLIVINTASIQLIPTTVAAVRAGLGAQSPFDILPAVWVTSLCAAAAGLAAAKVCSRWVR